MKRYIHSSKEKDTLELNIDFYFIDMWSLQGVVATEIDPVVKDWLNHTVNPDAKGVFNTFVTNCFEIISAYDFEILDDFKKTSPAFPGTSEYRWIAHKTELEKGEVPKFIKIRISDHDQNFSDERKRQVNKKSDNEAQSLKLPKTKKKQRWVLENIVINGETHETYEEALHDVEMTVRSWLESRGIDLEPYGPAIW